MKEKTKKPIFKKAWFWVIIIVILSLFYSIGSKENTSDNIEQTEQAQTENQETNQEENTISPDTKETAKEIDTVYKSVAKLTNDYYSIFSEKIQNSDAGSNELLDLYDTCKDLKQYMPKYSEQLDTKTSEYSAEYKDAIYHYIWTIYGIADDVIAYIDDEKTEDLSNAKEGIELIPYYQNEIVSKRSEYLKNCGFSETEIDNVFE